MLFMNQDKIYGRAYREESGGDGDDGAGGASNSGGNEPTVAELQAQLDSMTGERDSLNGKVSELLGETKKAKQERKIADTAAAAASKKQAEADGNYQELFNSSETERESLASQLDELTSTIQAKEKRALAQKIALALGPVSDGALEDLVIRVERRLKNTDDGIKITDESGGLTVSNADALQKELAGSAGIAHLLKGTQSSGGGASGGSNGSGAASEMNRAEFNALNQPGRLKFVRGGGKVID